MGNILSFTARTRKTTNQSTPIKQLTNHSVQGNVGGFMEQVSQDTHNLCTATGKTTEEAIQMAGDFYRRYPMLMEYVRSPEYMLRGK